jgi:hypothetical protein
MPDVICRVIDCRYNSDGIRCLKPQIEVRNDANEPISHFETSCWSFKKK